MIITIEQGIIILKIENVIFHNNVYQSCCLARSCEGKSMHDIIIKYKKPRQATNIRSNMEINAYVKPLKSGTSLMNAFWKQIKKLTHNHQRESSFKGQIIDTTTTSSLGACTASEAPNTSSTEVDVSLWTVTLAVVFNVIFMMACFAYRYRALVYHPLH